MYECPLDFPAHRRSLWSELGPLQQWLWTEALSDAPSIATHWPALQALAKDVPFGATPFHVEQALSGLVGCGLFVSEKQLQPSNPHDPHGVPFAVHVVRKTQPEDAVRERDLVSLRALLMDTAKRQPSPQPQATQSH
jgi:hypothetical protein